MMSWGAANKWLFQPTQKGYEEVMKISSSNIEHYIEQFRRAIGFIH